MSNKIKALEVTLENDSRVIIYGKGTFHQFSTLAENGEVEQWVQAVLVPVPIGFDAPPSSLDQAIPPSQNAPKDS